MELIKKIIINMKALTSSICTLYGIDIKKCRSNKK